MGMLADLIPAPRAKAAQLLRAAAAYEDLGGRDVKGLAYVTLERLAIHVGAPAGEALTVLAHDDAGVVALLHPSFVTAAAAWDHDTVDSLTRWWTGTEELAGVPEDWVAEHLFSLRWVAQDAQRKKVDVLYWGET